MSSRFFQNRTCEYFPCHKLSRPEEFNCLFCYCPLYALGERCGGAPRYTAQGVKDCSACTLPHRPGGYEAILSRFPELAALAAKQPQAPPDAPRTSPAEMSPDSRESQLFTEK